MAAQFLRVKNFEKYQHYKKRNPPWIKLYYELLDDDDFISLTLESRHHYMTLLLIAGRKNNTIPYDLSYLKKVMRLDVEPDLTQLISTGFLLASRKHTASAAKLNLKQNALSETEADISETEADISETEPSSKRLEGEKAPAPLALVTVQDFDKFWIAYPRKVGKEAARKAWKKIKVRPPIEQVVNAIQRARNDPQWKKDQGQYIPHPSTWLNEGRWDDEPIERVGMSDPSGMMAGFQDFLQRGQS